jgi:hypothetical protein
MAETETPTVSPERAHAAVSIDAKAMSSAAPVALANLRVFQRGSAVMSEASRFRFVRGCFQDLD